MWLKQTLLTVGVIGCASSAFAVDIKDFNYDPSVSSKDIGVDIKALVECGSGYADGHCDSANVSQSGYKKNTVVLNAIKTAKKAEGENDIAGTDAASLKRLGINAIDDVTADQHHNKSRDIKKQKTEIDQVVGSWSGNDVSDLTKTYNTGQTADSQGLAFKYQCMSYSDNQLDLWANGGDMKLKSLANQCLSVRVVANTNDQALANRPSKNDPLRKNVVKRDTTNRTTNTAVANINTPTGNASSANSMAYDCDAEPTARTTKSGTCNTRGFGRGQVCTQSLVVSCGAGSVGQRPLPECTQALKKSSFKIENTTRQILLEVTDTSLLFGAEWIESKKSNSTNKWSVSFEAADPAKVKMTLIGYYYDNAATVYLNGHLIFSASNGTGQRGSLYVPLDQYLIEGKNLFEATVNNWGGPAGLKMNIAIAPESTKSCTCKESWQTTCTTSKVGL